MNMAKIYVTANLKIPIKINQIIRFIYETNFWKEFCGYLCSGVEKTCTVERMHSPAADSNSMPTWFSPGPPQLNSAMVFGQMLWCDTITASMGEKKRSSSTSSGKRKVRRRIWPFVDGFFHMTSSSWTNWLDWRMNPQVCSWAEANQAAAIITNDTAIKRNWLILMLTNVISDTIQHRWSDDVFLLTETFHSFLIVVFEISKPTRWILRKWDTQNDTSF